MSEYRDSIYKGLLGGGITLAACLLAVFVYVTFFGGDERAAEDACKEAIEEDLKAPSTAEWSAVEVSGSTEGDYTVTGDVDSENSYGAKIRGSFACTVTDGNVVSHSVSEQ